MVKLTKIERILVGIDPIPGFSSSKSKSGRDDQHHKKRQSSHEGDLLSHTSSHRSNESPRSGSHRSETPSNLSSHAGSYSRAPAKDQALSVKEKKVMSCQSNTMRHN